MKMTVAELIAKLQNVDPNTIVAIDLGAECPVCIEEASVWQVPGVVLRDCGLGEIVEPKCELIPRAEYGDHDCDCPVGQCGKPARGYRVDGLDGYIEACADHAHRVAIDALEDQGSSDEGELFVVRVAR